MQHDAAVLLAATRQFLELIEREIRVFPLLVIQPEARYNVFPQALAREATGDKF
ncbi:MAG: hypothetical protein ABI600_12100 [Luteolibacter sp.]